MTTGTLVPKPMARKTPPPQPPDEAGPSSETARIASDLMEMMRTICFHSRDTRGKRTKITQLLDSLLRPVVTREHEKLQQQLRKAEEK